MKLDKAHTLLYLFLWFGILAFVYWGFGETPYTIAITRIYLIACILLSVAYLAVSGTSSLSKKGKAAPRINPLGLKPEAQEKWSKILLILDFPFLAIFLMDYLFLKFFF